MSKMGKVFNKICISKKIIKEIEDYCNQKNLKYDTTACEILTIINKEKDGE